MGIAFIIAFGQFCDLFSDENGYGDVLQKKSAFRTYVCRLSWEWVNEQEMEARPYLIMENHKWYTGEIIHAEDCPCHIEKSN